MYLAGTQTISNLKLYQKSISNLKAWIIDQNFWKSFENSINWVYKIFSLIKSNPEFFDQNSKFLLFLKNPINEILESYYWAFEYLKNPLENEKKSISSLKNIWQGELLNILSENLLQKQKDDFSNTKNSLLELKI